ncbi:MAG: conjugal transfer protein TraF [Granulosicoccaceae bacterium]
MRYPFSVICIPNYLAICIPACLVTLLFSGNVAALDARSIALGGSTISNGSGVHGALENPATLMHLQNLGERAHFQMGASVDLRDSANVADIVDENPDLVDDFETEIDALSGQTVSCDIITANADTVCLTDTAELGALSASALNILNTIDGQNLGGQAAFDIGFAKTNSSIPFGIHLRVMATGIATPNVADSDKNYTSVIADTLSDDILTFGEISDNIEYAVETTGLSLSLRQPEDTFESTAEVAALLRTQLGISLARTFTVNGHNYDIGITPKFSKLEAGFIDVDVADQFTENNESLSDQFENSNTESNSTTFDFGVSTQLTNRPIRVAAVLRNAISESISLANYTFETTPQLILGGSYQLPNATINADLALNKAKLDNLESQKIGLGIEWQKSSIAIRAGISHDAARDDSATALSLGLGLGPLELGTRLTDTNEGQFGLQLAFSY